MVGQVGHAGVHDGHRGVAAGPLEREQQRERSADREAAADDDDVAPLDRDVVGVEELDDAGGRARQRARCAHARGGPG